jgi:hypothetical protein
MPVPVTGSYSSSGRPQITHISPSSMLISESLQRTTTIYKKAHVKWLKAFGLYQLIIVSVYFISNYEKRLANNGSISESINSLHTPSARFVYALQSFEV